MVNKEIFEKYYFLKSNPFFESSYIRPMVDRKTIRKNLSDLLNSFLDNESPQMLFLTGRYGMGKTFTLLEIDRDIRNKKGDFFSGGKVLSCYIRMVSARAPSDYLLYIYKEIMKALGIDAFKDLFKEFKELSKNPTSQDLIKKFNADASLDFKNAFSKFDTEHRNTVWNYLRGENISASEMKVIGVADRIDSGAIAENALADFLKLLKMLNYKAIVLLIDEFENIFTLTGSRKTAEILVSFREIYDRENKELYDGKNLSKTIFVFGSSESVNRDIQELIKKLGAPGLQPFLDRLVASNFDLEEFDYDYTKELITKRLANERTKEIDDDIFPFDNDYVKFIKDNTHGNPRLILQYSAVILDSASDKELKKITTSQAEEILKEHHITL